MKDRRRGNTYAVEINVEQEEKEGQRTSKEVELDVERNELKESNRSQGLTTEILAFGYQYQSLDPSRCFLGELSKEGLETSLAELIWDEGEVEAVGSLVLLVQSKCGEETCRRKRSLLVSLPAS